jgi:hypothetical protein
MKIRFLFAGLLATANFCFGGEEVIHRSLLVSPRRELAHLVEQGGHVLLGFNDDRLFISSCGDMEYGSLDEDFCIMSDIEDEKNMQYHILANVLREGILIEAWVQDGRVCFSRDNRYQENRGRFSVITNELLFAMGGNGLFCNFLSCFQSSLGLERPIRFFSPYGINGIRIIHVRPTGEIIGEEIIPN